MKKLEFKIDIHASKQKVWNTMFAPDTYRKWVDVSWPGAYYKGNLEKGENVKFLSPGSGGTLAELVEFKPHDYVLAKHVAVIESDGSEDRDSELAKGWIGTTESYSFTKLNGNTEVKVEINTTDEWVKMFKDGWPNALNKLKEICES